MKNNHTKRSGVFFQIVLPLFFLILATGTGIYFIVFSKNTTLETTSQAGDIATIYLNFLLIVPIFFIIALLILFIVLNIKASHSLSSVFPKISTKVEQVNESIRTASNTSTKPIIEIDAYLTVINNYFSKKEKDGKK